MRLLLGMNPPPAISIATTIGMQLPVLVAAANKAGWMACALLVCFIDLIPFMPCGPAAFTSGVLFSTSKGLLVASSGQAGAALCSFLIGRLFLRRILTLFTPQIRPLRASDSLIPRPWTQGAFKLHPRIKAVIDGLDRSSFQKQFFTFLLLRQSPLVPFSVCNYSVGAMTRVSILPFAAGTFLGCMPGNLLLVSSGAAAADNQHFSGEGWAPILGSVGVVATAVLVYGAIRLATKEMRFADEEGESPHHEDQGTTPSLTLPSSRTGAVSG